MRRHLIPRVQWQRWYGDALTIAPGGGVEMPPGLARNMRIAFGNPTTTPEHDEITGGTITIQWLGIIVEIAIGKVR